MIEIMTFEMLLWNVCYLFSVTFVVNGNQVGAPCDNTCSWLNWGHWSVCTVPCGGSGRRNKTRSLCCPPEDDDYTVCATNCGLPLDGPYYSESCGGTCSNGGSLKSTGFGCNCLDRSFGHCCEHLETLFCSTILPGCSPFPTDVIFVLDSSASQTKEHFQSQLNFVIKFVEHVNINAEEFQIAVVTYSTDAKVEIDFDQTASVNTLRQLIGNITFRPGVTFTDKGLRAAMEIATKSERREGMVTLSYAFVLTDGMSNKRIETRLAAIQLKNSGVHVVAIGIGKEVSHQELKDIASPGDSFSPSYVFSVEDFNALDTLLKQLVQATCKDCSAISHISDILFLLDESNQMTETEFQLSVDIMTSVVQSTDRIGVLDGPQFALAQLTSNLENIIPFSDGQFQTQNEILVKLQTLYRRLNGFCETDKHCSEMNITSAVISIIESYFEQGGRQNARRFFVILSNGRFQSSTAIKADMAEIHGSSDVRLFVIGPGLDVNMDGILSWAKEANHVYVTIDDNDMSKLDVLQSEFTYNVCTKT